MKIETSRSALITNLKPRRCFCSDYAIILLKKFNFSNYSIVLIFIWNKFDFKYSWNYLISTYYLATEDIIYREVLRLQYFYNKSWVVSYYWFKFEFSIEITFLTQQ